MLCLVEKSKQLYNCRICPKRVEKRITQWIVVELERVIQLASVEQA